jgi:hypothetical protein
VCRTAIPSSCRTTKTEPSSHSRLCADHPPFRAIEPSGLCLRAIKRVYRSATLSSWLSIKNMCRSATLPSIRDTKTVCQRAINIKLWCHQASSLSSCSKPTEKQLRTFSKISCVLSKKSDARFQNLAEPSSHQDSSFEPATWEQWASRAISIRAFRSSRKTAAHFQQIQLRTFRQIRSSFSVLS